MPLTSLKCSRFVWILVIVVLLQFASFSPVVELLYSPLVVNDRPEPCEAIVILSSDFFESGLPSIRTYARLTKGLELYRKGMSPVIICSGGGLIALTGHSYARAMKDTLVSWGVDKESVRVHDETINTYNDIQYLTGRAAENKIDFNKTIFVTSSYHTLRVRLILNRLGIRAKVVSAEQIELQPNVWSLRPDFLREVVREYGALVYFKLKGWI